MTKTMVVARGDDVFWSEEKAELTAPGGVRGAPYMTPEPGLKPTKADDDVF